MWTSPLVWLEAKMDLAPEVEWMGCRFFRSTLSSRISTRLVKKAGPRTGGSQGWRGDDLHCWWWADVHTVAPPCRGRGWHAFQEIQVLLLLLWMHGYTLPPKGSGPGEAPQGRPRCSLRITTISKCNSSKWQILKSVSLELTFMKALWRRAMLCPRCPRTCTHTLPLSSPIHLLVTPCLINATSRTQEWKSGKTWMSQLFRLLCGSKLLL